ncbi:haloacid dehalogenase [Paenibacillus peoriae]|uniref:haloacid dehalogenase-like hydrolase n=2 Tax=Paenibacillus TaxID=44249 RepID=UPI00026C6877|nr:haloacid dehalogenase-like hydrolase [Paenibacillus peoriae]MEC0182321.1 haloacid dehalogenase [Paenibacillus peoriae]
MDYISDFSYIDDLIDNKGVRNAVIDVDNTITKSNIVQFYLFIKKQEIGEKLWPLYFSSFVLRAPYFLTLDAVSRDSFNKLFVLKKFKKYSYAQLEYYSKSFFEKSLKRKFISFTHDLIFHLKEKGVHVELLSTNFDLLVKQYGHYFDVPYSCLNVKPEGNGITIDFSNLDGFKGREIAKFDPAVTLSIGDSKYDLPALNHVDYPFVVAKKDEKWMGQINKEARFIKADIVQLSETL